MTGIKGYLKRVVSRKESMSYWLGNTWRILLVLFLVLIAVGDALHIESVGATPHYDVVFIGDSLMHNNIPPEYAALKGWTYLDSGVAGQKSYQISARFAADAIAYTPRFIVADGGINDVANYEAEAPFIAAWTSMLNAAQAANVQLFILALTPFNGMTNAQSAVKDTWNADLRSLAAGYSVAHWDNFNAKIGQFRVGGNPGNLWDWQAAYDSGDGVHPNAAGQTLLAGAFAASDSLVATTTTNYGTSEVGQTKTFYGAGIHWAFYSDGTNIVFDTSALGLIWTGSPTTVGAGTEGEMFDLFYDGTNVHYAIQRAGHLYYRKGAPQGDGSITWAAAEQDAGALSGYYARIAVTTGGNAFVSYQLAGDSKYYVVRNDNTNGTWSTTAGFPYKLTDVVNSRFGTLTPMSGNRMLVTWVPFGGAISAAVYDGGWGVTEAASSSNVTYPTATSIGDDIYLALHAGGSIVYTKRTAASGTWSAEATLAALNVNVLAAADATQQMVWFIFPSTASPPVIRYRRLVGGVLDAAATDWFTAPAALTRADALSINPQVRGDVLSVSLTTTATPKEVHYAWLTRPTVTAQAETGLTMDKDAVTGGTFNYNVTAGVGGSPGDGTVTTSHTIVRYATVSDGSTPYSYTYATSVNDVVATGATTRPIATSLTPGATYYYRATADDWGWSSERTMTLTMPTVATAAATNTDKETATLNASVSSMGVASSFYLRFYWGYAPGSLTESTPEVAITTTGTKSANISGHDKTRTVYYRATVRVGAVSSNKTTLNFVPQTMALTTGAENVIVVTPLLVWVALLGGGIYLLQRSVRQRQIVSGVVGLALFVIAFSMFPIILDALTTVRSVMGK